MRWTQKPLARANRSEKGSVKSYLCSNQSDKMSKSSCRCSGSLHWMKASLLVRFNFKSLLLQARVERQRMARILHRISFDPASNPNWIRIRIRIRVQIQSLIRRLKIKQVECRIYSLLRRRVSRILWHFSPRTRLLSPPRETSSTSSIGKEIKAGIILPAHRRSNQLAQWAWVASLHLQALFA